jgi:Mg2+ and Co2+ transporter CorA
MLQEWVETWELNFARLLGEATGDTVQKATVDISNALSLVGEFRRRLAAFDQARAPMSDKAWYPDLTDRGEQEQIDSDVATAEKNLSLLFQTVRGDMDLLMLRSMGTQQESGERLEEKIGKITALFLVPTLIAGIFGANTRLPGGGQWRGFDLMVVLMVCSALVLYLTMFPIKIRNVFKVKPRAK